MLLSYFIQKFKLNIRVITNLSSKNDINREYL